MKKISFIFASILLLSANLAFAQTGDTTRFEQTKLWRFMNKDLSPGVKSGAQKVLEMPAKNIPKAAGAYLVQHKIGLTTTLLLGGATFSVMYLRDHPEVVERYLEGHPEQIPYIEEKLSQYDWGQEYLDKIGVGERFLRQQEDLERTPEWQAAFQQVQTQIVAVAESQTTQYDCQNLQIAEAIRLELLKSPAMFYNSTVGQTLQMLTVMNNGPIFNVDTYEKLTAAAIPGDQIENDHIPSKASVREFFKLNKTMSPLEIKNLYLNLSSISIHENMHKKGRTWGSKNSEEVILNDAKNLKFATIKDLTNHFLYTKKYNLDMAKFLKSAIILYSRNKTLCLF